MNMVRIRRILEMRKELRAPPLLPPKLKKNSLEPLERTPRDIVIFHFQLRNSSISSTEPVLLSIHESESGGRKGPWKLTAYSDPFFLSANEFNDLPSVFSIEFEFEIVQPIKIDLCLGTEDSTLSLASSIFTVSQVINNRRLTLPLMSESRGDEISQLDVWSSIKPPPPPALIQFQLRDLSRKFISDSAMLHLIVHEAKEGKELYRSEGQKTSSRVTFRHFTLSIHDEMEIIVITVLYRDEKTKNEIVIGEAHTTVHQLERDSLEGRVYQMMRRSEKKEGRRVNGLLEALRVASLPIQSFLQLISNGTSLHLSFALDFSSSDDHFSPCVSNDAEFILRSIGDCVEDYANKSISALGFAARIPPMDRESQQFCLSLDTNPYCESMDWVVECLHRSTQRVQPSKNAHLSHVIYYVSKLAIHANLRRSGNNTQYFVLVILTRGVIDDLKEVVQAVIFASKAPISIVFVGMGDRKKDELDRLGRGGTRISYQGRRVTRDLLHFVDVNSITRYGVDETEDRNSFSELALSRVPSQLSSFLSKMTSTRTTSRSRGFESMNSVESEETDEEERRSRMEQYRISINGDQSDEGERMGRNPYDRSSQRSMSCLSRDVRSMSIASDKEDRSLRRIPHDFPTF